MTISVERVEVYSVGTETPEVLGFSNEGELEKALVPLMQEVTQKDSIAI